MIYSNKKIIYFSKISATRFQLDLLNVYTQTPDYRVLYRFCVFTIQYILVHKNKIKYTNTYTKIFYRTNKTVSGGGLVPFLP